MDEHHHVDASEGKLSDEEDEVYPRKEEHHGSKLPLEVVRTLAIGVEDPSKYHRSNEEHQLDPVDPVHDVVYELKGNQLKYLHYESNEC